MVDLKLCPIPAESVSCAAGLLSPQTLDELCEGPRFAPDCFALGVWENSSLKGALAGRGGDGGVFELLEMNYNRALRPETGELLLRGFERRARLHRANALTCTLGVPEEDLRACLQPFAAAGWSAPERVSELLYIETPNRDLHRRTKTRETACEILPLGDVPAALCLRYLDTHGADCDFTGLGELIPELSLACVEDGGLRGYIAFVPGVSAVEAVRVRLPEDGAAGGLLIQRTAEAYCALGFDAMILRVDAAYGEKVSRQLFGSQIAAAELLMHTEKTLREDAQ